MILHVLTFFAVVACTCAALSYSSGGLGGLGGFGGLSSEGGGLGGGSGGGEGYKTAKIIEIYTIPKYEYKYEVNDPKTGDIKEQKEEREGDKVRGEYSLKEPDGTIRVVKYEADKENGFNAKVERRGHAFHPYGYKKE